MHIDNIRMAAPGWPMRREELLGRVRITELPHFTVTLKVHTSTQPGTILLGIDVEPASGPAFPVDVGIKADVLAHELAPGG